MLRCSLLMTTTLQYDSLTGRSNVINQYKDSWLTGLFNGQFNTEDYFHIVKGSDI